MAAIAQEEPEGMPWWIVLLEGIAAIIVGLFLLASPIKTTFVLVQLLAIWWFITGIFQIITIFIDRSRWGWKLFSGLLGIIVGMLIIQHPLWSTLLVPTVIIYIIAILGLVIGVIELIQAFQGGGWGIGILGVLSILFGLILLSNPYISAALLPWVLGFFGIVGGIIAVIYSFRLR
jgi:uncharacterized membrane protein HdeD (DUF308 family)